MAEPVALSIQSNDVSSERIRFTVMALFPGFAHVLHELDLLWSRIKSVLRGIKPSSIFAPIEDLKIISLSGTFQLITENNMPPFLWCPQLLFSAPQYPVFPAGCSQMDAPDKTLGVKASLCKTHVDCLPGNSSSRPISKVTNKLRCQCPPMSSRA
ncbi:hypothetical protein TNCV_3351901 [Trichonephila clavipes]|nr:hypothetical protein TNCV_3351901 [Trichonephila clavipes]